MQLECQHFLTCIQERKRPLTDGESGLKVLKVLEASQMSLERGGVPVPLAEVTDQGPTTNDQSVPRSSLVIGRRTE